MEYIKFEISAINKIENQQNRSDNILAKIGFEILKKIIPQANPDFDDKINSVKTWLIEIDEETNFPNREIGLCKNNIVIIIMPYEKNYGYWTDNNLNRQDFKNKFGIEKIEAKEFEEYWMKFGK